MKKTHLNELNEKQCIEYYGKQFYNFYNTKWILSILNRTFYSLLKTSNCEGGSLYPAVLSGDLKAIRYLIEEKKFSHNSKSPYGSTLLHFAFWSGELDVIHYFIEELKYSPTVLTDSHSNILHFAARGGNIKALEYVLNKFKIPFNSKNNKASTPFMYAAYGGSIKMMDYFIKRFKNLSSQLSQPANQEHCVSNHDVVFR